MINPQTQSASAHHGGNPGYARHKRFFHKEKSLRIQQPQGSIAGIVVQLAAK
jgi:hypothetical protein